MKNRRLHELAKFASGLVAGDLLAVLWLDSHAGFPTTFLGLRFTEASFWPVVIFDAALLIILIHYGWHIGKTPRFTERTYLLVAGTVFGVVALAHLIRIFTGASLVLVGWTVPLWLSWIGTAATAYLSYMSYSLAMRMR